MDPPESLRETARTGRLETQSPPLRGVRGVDVTEQSTRAALARAGSAAPRLAQAQRAVDICLSELLAAGPAGERRVSREIDRVTGLVDAAASAFDAYSARVRESQHGSA